MDSEPVFQFQSGNIGTGEGYYVRGGELPDNVVYMIMERLHVTDIVRFACVCKAFHCVFKQNPSCIKQEWPCLMITNGLNNRKREFAGLVNKKRYTIQHKDFAGAQLLDSKKGWLLFSSSKCLFLFHIITRNKLFLPTVVDMPISIHQATISSVDSITCIPSHVVLASHTSSRITVAIASPGDLLWRKYTCKSISDSEYGHRDFTHHEHWDREFNNLHVAGKYVYCIDRCMRVYIFDMENLQWDEFKYQMDVTVPGHHTTYENSIEVDGDLIRVCSYLFETEDGKKEMCFDVYKLDRDKQEWKFFYNRDKLKELSLFLDVKKVLSIAKRIPTRKIHLIHNVQQNITNISAHDIDDHENLLEQPFGGGIKHPKNYAVPDIILESSGVNNIPHCSWVDMDFDSFCGS